ncbi:MULTISPECIES: ABC transporter ATP-binding protein [Nonomuraea]|uniref:ATP-binding cassette domain-containing protein n=1 Tax=Nonomuraea ferruginea TaxID=46174 RepID=A0ABT4SQU2_9ACTN|nr:MULTISPECIES: ATP-binding cassette domain-containing protein [Nonomuraea]MDA0639636.1 ATP-binding cassette domain-containing protein [Nonomuraea ferruginea]TXK40101.1 ATP-binding cassette domain-containing protein [Nonomuraea sp. C10]
MATIASLSGVTVAFGGIVAMNDVSFDVPSTGIMALIGPNGAGKTTAFNVLSGHIRPRSGTVEVFGTAASALGPAGLAGRGLARSWQDGRAFLDMTVLENLVVAVRCPRAESPFWRLARPRRAARLEAGLVRQADEVLETLGLSAFRDHRAGDIGYAEQRLVGIGRLLIRRPRLLLLDEPAAGLDGESIDRVVGIVRDIAAGGLPVVIVEHSLSVVRSLADSCVFMSNGEVVARGTPEDLFRRDELIDMYFGKGWRA